MKTVIYYFSGTGNSLMIANTLKEKLADAMILPILGKNMKVNDVSEADTIVVVYPVYFLDMPQIVKEFVIQTQWPKSAKVYAVANCGETLGNGLINFEQLILKKQGTFMGGFCLIMPDNSIIFPSHPERIESMIQSGIEKSLEIGEQIAQSQKQHLEYKHKLRNRIIKAGMAPYAIKILGFNKMQVNKKLCTNCNICQKICTAGNIHVGDTTPKWGDTCDMCFACIHWCPNKAVTFKKQKTANWERYTNTHIKLKQFMDAQKQ